VRAHRGECRALSLGAVAHLIDAAPALVGGARSH
jgi:hypothetical protein